MSASVHGAAALISALVAGLEVVGSDAETDPDVPASPAFVSAAVSPELPEQAAQKMATAPARTSLLITMS
jgi:hypothetical protein